MAQKHVSILSIGVEADVAPLQTGMKQAGEIVDSAMRTITVGTKEADDVIAKAGLSASRLAREAQKLQDRIEPLGPAQRRYNRELEVLNSLLASGNINQQEYGRGIEFAKEKLQQATIATQRYSGDVAQLKAAIDPAWAALQRYEKQVELLNRAQAEGALTQSQYSTQFRKAKVEFENAGKGIVASTGAQKAGMQQLSYQISDVATMYAMGARPAQIFASQIGQTTQAIQLMTGGTSRLASFLGGPWGIAIGAAIAVLGPLVAKLWDGEKAMDAVKLASSGLTDAQSVLGDMFDLVTGKIKNQNGMLRLNAQLMAMNMRNEAMAARASAQDAAKASAQSSWWEWIKEGAPVTSPLSYNQPAPRVTQASKLLNDVMSGKVDGATAQSMAGNWDFSKRNIDKMEYMQALSDATTASLKEQTAAAIETSLAENKLDKSLMQVGETTKKTDKSAQRRAESLAREARATEAAIDGHLKLADAYLAGGAAALKAEITAKALSQGIKKRADLEAFVSQQIRLAAAERISDGAKTINSMRQETATQKALSDQVAAGLLTSEEAATLLKNEAALRPLIAAQSLTEGAAKEKLASIIKDLRDAQKDANDEAIRARDLAQAEQIDRNVGMLSVEIGLTEELGRKRRAAMRGLAGDTLEDELARLNHEHEKAVAWMRATAEAAELEKRGMNEAAAATLRAAKAQAEMADQEFVDEQALRDLERANEQLLDLADLLQRIGGLGAVVGGALSFLAGDIGGGKVGSALELIFNTRVGEKTVDGEKIAVTIGDELRHVFGEGGPFGKTLQVALQGAGIGAAASNAIFGKQGTTGQIGSAIGGALGQAAGQAIGKAIGGLAGKLGGPVGSILGGVLGGAIGGLLKTNRTARANITGVDSISLGGKKTGSYDTANDLADAVIGGLQQIADVLGAEIGAFNTTIGVRGKDFRVNPDGTSLKKKNGAIDFNDDSAAAIAYAIADAVQDGAFKGLSAGIENLLTKPGSDLDAQLQKALSFQGVFDYLEQQADPVAYALKGFGQQVDNLRAVFDEAGASADDYAKLEEYVALQRAEIIKQAEAQTRQEEQDARDEINKRRELEIQIMQMQGQAEAAITLARQMEREEIEESLRPLLDQIHALQDAAAKREMEIQLLEALGMAEEAQNARRAEYLKTVPESLRGLQMQIWAAQDATKAQEEYASALASARDDLVGAYNRESGALQQTADKFRNLADALRDFRDDLFGVENGIGDARYALVRLMSVGAQAGAGNADAMAALPGVGRDYLNAARDQAATKTDYARQVALVAGYAEKAIGSAQGQASAAERQIELMKRQVEALTEIGENDVSLAEAMARVKELLESPVVPDDPTPVVLPEDYVINVQDIQTRQLDALEKMDDASRDRLDELIRTVESLLANQKTMSADMSDLTRRVKDLIRDGDILAVEVVS